LTDLLAYNSLSGQEILSIGQRLIIGHTALSDGSSALAGYPRARVLADGAIVHTVAPGETPGGIAFLYNLSLDELYEWNDLGPESLLQIDQELIVGRQPQPEATGASADAPAPEPAATAESSPPSSTATTAPQATTAPPVLTATAPAVAAGNETAVSQNESTRTQPLAQMAGVDPAPNSTNGGGLLPWLLAGVGLGLVVAAAILSVLRR
jgi:hypothetical protein